MKIFDSPEEQAAWEAGAQDRQQRLLDRIARIRAEITAGMTPEELAAWEELHSDSGKALGHRIKKIAAELEAHRKSA